MLPQLPGLSEEFKGLDGCLVPRNGLSALALRPIGLPGLPDIQVPMHQALATADDAQTMPWHSQQHAHILKAQ